MTLYDAIKVRTSRRRYDGEPLPQAQSDMMAKRIAQYNAEAGLSMRLIRDASAAFSGFRKSYGMFKGVCSVILMAGPKTDPDMREKLGYYGELLVLEATTMGLGTCWVAGTFDKNNDVFAVPDSDEMACVIVIGGTQTDRGAMEKFIYRMAHRKSKSVEEMSRVGEPPPKWFVEGMRAVVAAPSAINAQPVVVAFEDGVASASADGRMLDLGIAKAHFVLGARDAGMRGHFAWGDGGHFVPD